MASTANTVILRQGCQNSEGIAGGAILPGHLVMRNSANAIVVHATAGGNCQKLFAQENELYGKGMTDAYAATNPIQLFNARAGDWIQARIKANENIAIGDYLESAGDGTLQKVTSDSADLNNNNVIGMAREATNTSTVVRLWIEIV